MLVIHTPTDCYGLVIMAGRMSLGQYAALDVLIGLSLSPLEPVGGSENTPCYSVAFAVLEI